MRFTKVHLSLAALCGFIFHTQTAAQLSWQRIEGPSGGYHHISVGTNGELVATNTATGLYTSDNGGQFWTFRAFPNSTHTETNFLKGEDGFFWFFDRDALYLSKDNSRTWSEELQQGSKWVENDMLSSIILENGLVMLGTKSTGIVRSVDSSKTLTTVFPIAGGLNALARNPQNGHLFAWKTAPTAGQINKIYRSTDLGLTWAVWENDALLTGRTINGLAFVPNGAVFIVTDQKALRSTDEGATWTQLNRHINEFCIAPSGRLFVVDDTNLVSNDFVYSDDNGDSWQPMPQKNMRKLTAAPDGTLFAERNWGSLYRSNDNGMSWQFSAFGIAHHTQDKPFLYFDKADQSTLSVTKDGLFYSPNGATDWELRRSTLLDSTLYYDYHVSAMRSDSILFYFFNKKLHRSTDKGMTWADVTPPAFEISSEFSALRMAGDVLFFSFDGGVGSHTLRSDDGGQTWQDLGDLQIQQLKEAPDGTFWAFNFGTTLRKSTDRGMTWSNSNTPPLNWPTEIIIFPNGTMVLIDNDKAHRSVNGGASWTTTPIALSYHLNSISSAIINSAGHLFLMASDIGDQLLLSVDEGQTFQYVQGPDSYWGYKFLYLTPDEHLIFVSGDGAWRSAEVSTDFLTIIGDVVNDLNKNCIPLFTEPRLSNFLVKATAANGQISYGISNEAGSFQTLAKPGTYQLTAVPPNDLWTPCDTSVTIASNITTGTVLRNVAVKAAALCPRLDVSVAAPLLRRCFEARLAVRYANTGTVPAENAKIVVVLDPFLDLLGTSFPIAQHTGDSLLFELGTLPVNHRSEFYIDMKVSCVAELGQMHCTRASIYPDTLCSGWQGAALKTMATCLGDSVLLEIRNEGMSSMAAPQKWQLWRGIWTNFDSALVAEGSFFLAAGGIFSVKIPADANADILYFKVPQDPGYPLGSGFAQTVLLHCDAGGGLPPYSFEYQAYEPSKDLFCMANIGSFDPNDKRGFPEGIGQGHHIEKTEPLDYLIRFQNTGTDTAFTVVIRDTLSQWLEVESVQFEGSSHPCVMNVRGSNELVFTFSNIHLPDSNINEAASHGFVRYSIKQKNNNPEGSVIRNRAGIYFDFNAPVMTNETWHTVGLPKLSGIADLKKGDPLHLFVSPNPFAERFWVGVPDFQFTENCFLEIADPTGRVLRKQNFMGKKLLIEREGLPGGLLFLVLKNANGRVLASGRVVASF